MSREMKLIMENWRKSQVNEGIIDSFKRFLGYPPSELDEPSDFSNVQTAGDFFNKIKATVKVAALYQRAEWRKELKVALGREVIDTALEFVKVTPGIGNAIALAQASVKMAETVEMGIELVAKERAIDAAVGKSLKGIAGQLVAIDDSKIDKHPLAKIFNISDQKEAVLRKEEMENFANWFLVFMQNFPNKPVGDAQTYADRQLAHYLKVKRGFQL